MWKQSLLQTTFLVTIAVLLESSQSQNHKLANGGEIKAVLLAGSKGWKNYRHQANICHAYHILRRNGIPDENIIVMIYDDIAYNKKNPYPGVVYNRPGGPNVYENCKKDYTGKDVNKKIFFEVLKGNKQAVKGIGSGRVLESGPNDHVFINFVDHGGKGILCMPDEVIYTSEVLEVFKEMANKSRFKKMFFYVEACFSGSVAQVIPKNLNIFIMTAANANESSHSCFDDDMELTTPLGDEFSVHWMRDAETVDLRNETVQKEFEKVHSEVKQSHVSEFGDLKLGNTKVSEVLGYSKHLTDYYPIHCQNLVPQYQIPVAILERQIEAAKIQEEKEKLEKELQDLYKTHEEMVQLFSQLAKEFSIPEEITSKHAELTEANLACYENSVRHLDDNCFKINEDPFVGTHLHKLINLCNLVPEAQLVEKVLSICL